MSQYSRRETRRGGPCLAGMPISGVWRRAAAMGSLEVRPEVNSASPMSFLDKIKSLFGATPDANDGATPDANAGATPDEGPGPKRRATSKEDARLEAEGRALFEGGDPTAALSLLRSRGILFARHEPTSLPCLCGRCLRPEVS